MTEGEQLIERIALKFAFRDRHDRRAYRRAVEIATRIVDDPSIIKVGEAFLEQHVRDDPHQARFYRLWREVIKLPPPQTARAMLEDTDSGAELRDSAPVFVVLSAHRNGAE